MSDSSNPTSSDPEIDAIGKVFHAVRSLESAAQFRVLQYVAGKLGVSLSVTSRLKAEVTPTPDSTVESTDQRASSGEAENDEGISPIALKWMKRNGLTVNSLSSIFSLGVDEIDLVAKSIPGKGKKERCYNVVLLKGIAEYLASGAARITQEQIKEACLHYDAFDAANFATYLKGFAADLGGSKSSGFALTARGLTNATELIKQLTQSSAK